MTKDRRNDPFVIRDGGFLPERTSVTLCWKDTVELVLAATCAPLIILKAHVVE